ncbi:MAG: M24 family metallopeptidase, partial [Turicibacter bilis]
ANAAMMHYNPTKEKCSVIEKKGFLLIDSGGQYLDGTTDITRTFVLGELTEEEKIHYTLVLKGHINLSKAVFQKGCSGGNLDILARQPLWSHGLDYRCGTGHGVSYFGGVHEGPQGFRLTQTVPLQPGMMTTNEPGVYEAGRHGIRIENTLLVVEKCATEYGEFYEFETISYFPIDTKAIIVEMLNDEELAWFNQYHQKVVETLSPHLTGKALEWLKREAIQLSR